MVVNVKIIGITGGVGAGKSQVLTYIEENYNCKIIRADEAAHLLEMPGQECYIKLVELLGKDILNDDETIDKKKMADCIFRDKSILEKVNQIIHPEVKKYIINQIAAEQEAKKVQFFFIEAALLIEEHYDEIVDEMWYIHCDADIRAKRLSQTRHYSGDLKETYLQIDEILGNEG